MDFIWPKGESNTKNFCCFFYLEATELGNDSKLRFAGESLYRIHVNGKFALTGPVKRAHGYGEIDTVPLGSFLEDGRACIAVEMTASNVYVLSDAVDAPFFAAEIVDGDRVRYSSGDFKAYALEDVERVVPRYSFQRAFLECYKMTCPRSVIYRGELTGLRPLECQAAVGQTLTERSVSYPLYDLLCTHEPVTVGRVAHDPDAAEYRNRFMYGIGDNGYAYASITDPLIEQVNHFAYTVTERLPSGDSFRLYDLGVDKSGYIVADIRVVSETARVIIIWDEVLGDDGMIHPLRMNMANMLRLDLGRGDYDFESMEAYTMKYIKVIVIGGEVDIRRVGVRKMENPDVWRLEFDCSDERYCRLMRAAQNTLAQNAVDILMDCPSRERAGWLCDSYFSGYAERVFSGENKVERNFLDNYSRCPYYPYFPKGVLPMTYPGEFPLSLTFIPNWMLWYILELREFSRRNCDGEMVRLSERVVDGVIEYFEKFENELGLLENLENWVFVEWSRANDFVKGINFPTNMLYSAALEAVAWLYPDKHGALASKAERIKAKVLELSLGELFFYDQALRDENGEIYVVNETSETCQYYAFFFGLATREKNGELFEVLFEKFGHDRDCTTVYPKVYKSNAFIGNILRLTYLSENGFEKKALEQTVDYYLYMTERTGTLWEYDTPKKSCCHGFAAYIAVLILRGLVGFDGVEGKHIRFISDFDHDTECTVKLPLSANEFATVTVNNGQRSITLPSGYQLDIVKKN